MWGLASPATTCRVLIGPPRRSTWMKLRAMGCPLGRLHVEGPTVDCQIARALTWPNCAASSRNRHLCWCPELTASWESTLDVTGGGDLTAVICEHDIVIVFSSLFCLQVVASLFYFYGWSPPTTFLTALYFIAYFLIINLALLFKIFTYFSLLVWK